MFDNFFNKENGIEIKFIEKINDLGFKIQKHVLSKQNKSEEIYYLWKDIKAVTFEESIHYKLIFSGKKNFVLDKSYRNLFALLINIPKVKLDADTKQQIDLICNSFQPCKICGAVAVYTSVCRDCGCAVWSENIDEHNSEEEYIKTEQLEYYATMDKDEKVEDFFMESEYFEFDPNFRPSINKSEILKYSEENFWYINDET